MSPLLDLNAIRSNNPLADVVAVDVDLKRVGRDLRGCCPFHDDRSPSFYLFDNDQRWICFGGCGSGDVLDYVQRREHVGLRDAAKLLACYVLHRPIVPAPKLGLDRDTRAEALKVWRSAGPIQGTPAEAYLRQRAITIALPNSLRFARLRLGWRDPMPALVALVADHHGEPCGLQRIYLTDEGRKANLPDGKVKFSLGRVRGGAVRLTPHAVSGMILSGSVEDGLSLVEIAGRAVWAAPGEGMLARMDIPPAVRSLVIGADADEPGRVNAERAVRAFTEQGREVRVIYPTAPTKDFNQELQEAR